MNKRIIAGAAALLVFSVFLTGCSDSKKKKKPSDDTGVNDTVVSETTEPEFREYSDDDFKRIDIELTYPDEQFPTEVSCTDLSGLDFGERVPLCYKDGFVQDFFAGYEEFPFDWHDFADKPVKGYADSVYEYNGSYFIEAVYPVLYGMDTDFAVFRYDPESEAPEEIYSWTAADISEHLNNNMVFSGGNLFFTVWSSDNDSHSAVMRLDLDSGEVTAMYEENNDFTSVWLYKDDSGEAAFFEFSNLDSEETSEIYTYDRDSGQFVKAAVPDDDRVMSVSTFDGVKTELIKRQGKRALEVRNESFYSIQTGISSGKVIYSDKDRLVMTDNVNLHTYDMKRMEHYVTKIRDMGSEIVMSGGKIFTGNRSRDFRMPVYCIIPELGLTFPVTEDGLYRDLSATDGGITFNSRKTEEFNYEYGGNTFGRAIDYIDKIYTLKFE